MKKCKILGQAGTDNYRVEDCPVHMPKENMKFFQYMRQQANTEPFNDYKQYGNAYHEDWQEKPSKPQTGYLKIMEAIEKGINNALNESGIVFGKADRGYNDKLYYLATYLKTVKNVLFYFISSYKQLYIDSKIEVIKPWLLNIDGKIYKLRIPFVCNENVSIRKKDADRTDIDGMIFLVRGLSHDMPALIMDQDVVHDLYYSLDPQKTYYAHAYKDKNGKSVYKTVGIPNVSYYAVISARGIISLARSNARCEKIDLIINNSHITPTHIYTYERLKDYTLMGALKRFTDIDINDITVTADLLNPPVTKEEISETGIAMDIAQNTAAAANNIPDNIDTVTSDDVNTDFSD